LSAAAFLILRHGIERGRTPELAIVERLAFGPARPFMGAEHIGDDAITDPPMVARQLADLIGYAGEHPIEVV
jgi:hypothetical protein